MIIKEFVLWPEFRKYLHVCIRSLPKESRGGGGLLHMNINLDSTNIIITGHKIVVSFFLRRFLLSVSILGAIFMHTSIFFA